MNTAKTTQRGFQSLEVLEGTSSKDWKANEHPTHYRDTCAELQRAVYRWQLRALVYGVLALLAIAMLLMTQRVAFPGGL